MSKKLKFSNEEWNVLIRGVYLAHEENVRLAKAYEEDLRLSKTYKKGGFFSEQTVASKKFLDKIEKLYFDNLKPKQSKTKKAK